MTVSEDPNGGKANMHVAGQSVQRVGEWGIPLASSGYVAQFVLSPRTTFTPSSHLMRLALSLIVCPLLAACLTEPKPCLNQPSDPATETFAPSLGIDLSTMEKTAIGDYRKDIVVGSGENLSALGVVQIHYSAFLVDGTVLDQFQDQPVGIDLATRATIGLADGMLGMNVGGQRVIVVPSQLAQGACPTQTIPGNSTIIYKVELLSIG